MSGGELGYGQTCDRVLVSFFPPMHMTDKWWWMSWDMDGGSSIYLFFALCVHFSILFGMQVFLVRGL